MARDYSQHRARLNPQQYQHTNSNGNGWGRAALGLLVAAGIGAGAYYLATHKQPEAKIVVEEGAHVQTINYNACCDDSTTVRYEVVAPSKKTPQPDGRGPGRTLPSNKDKSPAAKTDTIDNKVDSVETRLKEVFNKNQNYESPKDVYKTGDATFYCN